LDFFKEKFPESTVEYLSFKEIDISELEKSDVDNLSVYSIPISSAFKILEPKNKKIIQTNFLPKKIKEQQKWFKLAWHGLVFLIALCSALLYFLGQYLVMERKINQVEYVTSLLNEQIVSGESILTKLDSIETSINRYESNFTSYDSLTKNYDMVSVFLKNVSNNVKSTNSIWLNSLDVIKSGYSMKGESIYKSRIPTFVSFYDDYVINNVTGTKVRDKEIFQYEITGNLK
jgi:Tfp pilus assembly protein PilN